MAESLALMCGFSRWSQGINLSLPLPVRHTLPQKLSCPSLVATSVSDRLACWSSEGGYIWRQRRIWWEGKFHVSVRQSSSLKNLPWMLSFWVYCWFYLSLYCTKILNSDRCAYLRWRGLWKNNSHRMWGRGAVILSDSCLIPQGRLSLGHDEHQFCEWQVLRMSFYLVSFAGN